MGSDQKIGGSEETRVPEDDAYRAECPQRYGEAWQQSRRRLRKAAGGNILDLFEIGAGKKNRATEIVFVGRRLGLLKPGGRMGIVLPDGYLNNPSLSWLRGAGYCRDYFDRRYGRYSSQRSAGCSRRLACLRRLGRERLRRLDAHHGASQRGDFGSQQDQALQERHVRRLPGDIVFSRTDARNGAIGILPSEIEKAVVTSEFPIFTADAARLEGEFVRLVLRTGSFIEGLRQRASGTSGRKRITPDAFSDLRVPLPSISEQRKIVTAKRLHPTVPAVIHALTCESPTCSDGVSIYERSK